jgi:hypothetical protein
MGLLTDSAQVRVGIGEFYEEHGEREGTYPLLIHIHEKPQKP